MAAASARTYGPQSWMNSEFEHPVRIGPELVQSLGLGREAASQNSTLTPARLGQSSVCPEIAVVIRTVEQDVVALRDVADDVLRRRVRAVERALAVDLDG